MGEWKKPRAWSSPDGTTSTQVLYDPRGREEGDDVPLIFMHTNMGWIGPVNLDLDEGETVEMVAEQMGKGYELEEVDRERAIWLAGYEGQEEQFET